MTFHFLWIFRSRFLALIFPVLLLGCSQNEDSVRTKAGDDSPVVATVAQGRVTSADFESFVQDKLGGNPRALTSDRLQQWLDERILEEALYQEALRIGLDRDPEVSRDIRQMLTSRLIDDYMKSEVWNKEISEAELEAYYAGHWKEFNRPGQVRIADIFISLPENATDTERSELKMRAEMILDEAIAAKEDRFGFGSLVRDYSDMPAGYRKGDTGFFDKEGLPIDLDSAVVNAAFSLERVGDMYEGLVETPDGYHIIMLTGRRSGVNVPLENVRQQLTRRIRREKAEKARKAYLDTLKETAKIEVNKGVLEDVMNDLRADMQKGRTSVKGIIPPAGGEQSPPGLP